MTPSKDEVDAFIAHAAKGYDPVKAHEYYMRTRKLKGRPRIPSSEYSSPKTRRAPAKKLTKEQRTARKNELAKETEAYEEYTKRLREKAIRERDRIIAKIERLAKSFSGSVNDSRNSKMLMKQMQNVGRELKGEISKAREAYTQARENIISKY